MALADLRKELVCSICLSIYTDPVTLRCGHNFGRVCINHELDTQEGSRFYTCPECRKEYRRRPALEKNRKLCNIAEHVRCIPEERTELFCTYCIQSQVPAVKFCLKCEASLCDMHWGTHNPSLEHILSDPTTALQNRKCSVHNRVLEYYCTEDAACICASCCLIGEHRGHQVDSLDKASEKQKEKLRNVLQKLTTKRAEAEKRVQSLQECRREDQRKAAGVTETVTALFRDIRKQLKDLEKRVLSEISRWEEHVSLSITNLIQQLEINKDELSRKMHHIEELCNMSNPVTVLQEPDTGDLCETEDTERHDNQVHGIRDLDVGFISGTLHRRLSDIITAINTGIYVQEATDILLDVTTAGNTESDIITGINTVVNVQETTDKILDVTTAGDTESDIITGINTGIYVQEATDLLLDVTTDGDPEPHIIKGINTGIYMQETTDKLLDVTAAGDTESDILTGRKTGICVQKATDLLLDVTTASNTIQILGDRKTASWSDIKQNRPVTPERFQCPQVISTRGFSSGRHYWEVDVSTSEWWRVGMCYPSIDRRGDQSHIGCNNKSWCLCRYNDKHSVIPDRKEIQVADNIPCDRVRIYLDYEAGQLSFYSLCDPIRHLHTYTATFTEPLHAALWLKKGCIQIFGGIGKRRGGFRLPRHPPTQSTPL